MQVMIFDYDVHHGNGTHDIFYDDPDILFVSTHQQGSYPGTGKLSEVGSGDAQHATINIPLPGELGYRAGVQVRGEGVQDGVWVRLWGAEVQCRNGAHALGYRVGCRTGLGCGVEVQDGVGVQDRVGVQS